MRQSLIVVALALIAAAALADAPPAEPADHLIAFIIEDQFENEHTEAEFASKVMVLFWGDREGSNHIERWEKTVRRQLKHELADGTVDVRNVAHVEGVPGFIKGMIRGKFSEEPDAWVLMDWDGVFAESYHPTEKHCNILVFGADGAHLHQVASNTLQQDVLDGMLAAVERGLAGDSRPGQIPAPTMSPVD